MKKVLIGSVAVLVLLLTPSVALARTGDPKGNNGVIKINNEEAPDNIPDNHPHVSCTFSVDFYNYDKGSDYKAAVEFKLQPPTSGNGYSLKIDGDTHPFIGGDAAGGGTDLDASEKYKLSFSGTPHEQQGYHVKVTVQAPGSKGNDRKQKVFWVRPCQTPQVKDANTTTPSSAPTNDQVPPTTLPQTGGTLLTTAATVAVGASGAGYAFALRRSRK